MTGRRSTLRRYRGERWPVWAHVRLRWASCPVHEIIEAVPAGGQVLDVGCGHGLLTFTALGRADRVIGLDPDADKVAVARRAVEPTDQIEFRVGSVGELGADERFDTVLITDVLYLVPERAQHRWIVDLAGFVRPGGTMVIKEMAMTPRWKLRWTKAQEWVATGVAGLTMGGDAGLAFRDPIEVAEWLRDAGFEVEHRRADHGGPWPHHLLVAVRPPGRTEPDPVRR